MSVAANKARVQRFFTEVFNQQRHDTAAEILATDFVAHHPAFPDGIRGPDGMMQTIATFRAGFPNLFYILDEVFFNTTKAIGWICLRGR